MIPLMMALAAYNGLSAVNKASAAGDLSEADRLRQAAQTAYKSGQDTPHTSVVGPSQGTGSKLLDAQLPPIGDTVDDRDTGSSYKDITPKEDKLRGVTDDYGVASYSGESDSNWDTAAGGKTADKDVDWKARGAKAAEKLGAMLKEAGNKKVEIPALPQFNAPSAASYIQAPQANRIQPGYLDWIKSQGDY